MLVPYWAALNVILAFVKAIGVVFSLAASTYCVDAARWVTVAAEPSPGPAVTTLIEPPVKSLAAVQVLAALTMAPLTPVTSAVVSVTVPDLPLNELTTFDPVPNRLWTKFVVAMLLELSVDVWVIALEVDGNTPNVESENTSIDAPCCKTKVEPPDAPLVKVTVNAPVVLL
jgi:hypothetical protein